ncbi:hypothetical protein UFOVP1204_44 [uncultured Caudovirales phage]|uniref:Uncharacterized protein n=1 Tax=uncultured Caudovirales phage TaxID=2100421 RepID=A0A6J5Q0A7_9CAUD|nr:hypothetical protein UFOVP473_57 [uncultured Caudovirales phage]CAB4176812.1 hypothetical protein UFOVP983_57 [uncultured Caudovirales phage]CAB4190102.1 hypothetical protein UFOVP1204_44 [uncultured Caudovirales phage]
MDRRTIGKAIKEANRFLEIAAEVERQLKDREHFIVGTKNSGALRRASMDLTRALAEMRRP